MWWSFQERSHHDHQRIRRTNPFRHQQNRAWRRLPRRYLRAPEVAWEYLRLVDESPVDKAWLRSVGFTDDRAGCPTLGPLHIQSQPFQRPGRNTEYPAYACIRSLPIPIPKTRQDVRELCRLLGIPLQETTV